MAEYSHTSKMLITDSGDGIANVWKASFMKTSKRNHHKYKFNAEAINRFLAIDSVHSLTDVLEHLMFVKYKKSPEQSAVGDLERELREIGELKKKPKYMGMIMYSRQESQQMPTMEELTDKKAIVEKYTTDNSSMQCDVIVMVYNFGKRIELWMGNGDSSFNMTLLGSANLRK